MPPIDTTNKPESFFRYWTEWHFQRSSRNWCFCMPLVSTGLKRRSLGILQVYWSGTFLSLCVQSVTKEWGVLFEKKSFPDSLPSWSIHGPQGARSLYNVMIIDRGLFACATKSHVAKRQMFGKWVGKDGMPTLELLTPVVGAMPYFSCV